ncbi:MAG TPA: hypothetical protein VNT32_02120 [Thermoleophilaceae bacterium]|nr:hypothetical protein [Thermoleophilaceae bacterium]
MAAAAPARRRVPVRAPSRRAPVAKPARGRLRVVPRNPSARQASALGAGVLDRLLRGRGWIACIGLLLTGVVFFNVSLLQVNRGITSTSERSAELRRENAELRLRVAELASSERIQLAAGRLGFVLPRPGDVRYLEASPRRDARRAAKRIEAPETAPLPVSAPQTAAPTEQAAAPQAAQPAPAPPHTHDAAPAQPSQPAPVAQQAPAPQAGGAAPAPGIP